MEKELNAHLSIRKNGNYNNLFITLKDGTCFEVKYAFYNSRLAYKVIKVLDQNGK